jgi:hypothetical protein
MLVSDMPWMKSQSEIAKEQGNGNISMTGDIVLSQLKIKGQRCYHGNPLERY